MKIFENAKNKFKSSWLGRRMFISDHKTGMRILEKYLKPKVFKDLMMLFGKNHKGV